MRTAYPTLMKNGDARKSQAGSIVNSEVDPATEREFKKLLDRNISEEMDNNFEKFLQKVRDDNGK